MNKQVLWAVSLTALMAVGCGDDDGDGSDDVVSDAGRDAGNVDASTNIDASARPDGSLDAASDGRAGDAAIALSEAQVVGVATAINDGEVEAGQIAATKATSAAVRDYAELMVTAHTAANTRAQALGITPAASTAQSAVEAMATTLVTNLETIAAGTTFDRTYIQSQVELHQAALRAFDDLLLPNASTPALVTELERARGEIADHLELARSLASDGGI